MTRYGEFGDYLDSQKESFTIKFEKIEEIIGEKLPSSAYEHQAYWSNSDSHPLMKLILLKKWKSRNLNLETHEIDFYKTVESEKFYFVEKDFESLTGIKEDHARLFLKFKDLETKLKNNLGDSFKESNSKTGNYWKQNASPPVYHDYQWLGFDTKNTMQHKTFQVSINSPTNLSVHMWIDASDSSKFKKLLSKKINDEQQKFVEQLKALPSFFYVGTKYKDEKSTEIQIKAGINNEFLESVKNNFGKNGYHFYISRKYTKNKVIELGSDIVNEISKTFETLVPISEFLGSSLPAIKAHSCFILTQNEKSKFDDVMGEKYEYPKGQSNSNDFISGSKFIIQTKIDNKNYFVGHGKIDSILETEKTNEKGKKLKIAKYANYEKIEPPKLRTDEINEMMKSMPAYGSQPPSILPITRSLYKKITGEDLIEPDQGYDTMNLDPFIQALEWKPNLILYGPPGTGKTFHANEIAEKVAGSIPILKEHTWKSLAVLVLLENDGKPMNYHEIAKIALTKNRVNTQGETPHETIAKDMRNDMEQKGNDSFFVKSEDGVYGLNIPTTFEKAAEIILLAENKSMHTDDITEIAVKRKMIIQKDEPGVTPNRSMNQILSQDVKNNDLTSKFINSGPGTYGLRSQITNRKKSLIYKVTFHPSYSYEDFVEGYRPDIDDKTPSQYELKKGIFYVACKTARENPDSKTVLIIDEINRGNIPKILGELITLLEEDKRKKKYALNLAYSQDEFFVPENLRIIGTMNTADKSLMQMDDALKRRFVFEELMPDTNALLEHLKNEGVKNAEDYKKILDKINDKILGKGSDDAEQKMKQFRDRQIGHSYFWKIKNAENLQSVIKYDIIPLLQDYFYGDYNEIRKILGGEIISEDNRTTSLVDNRKEANDLKDKLLEI